MEDEGEEPCGTEDEACNDFGACGAGRPPPIILELQPIAKNLTSNDDECTSKPTGGCGHPHCTRLIGWRSSPPFLPFPPPHDLRLDPLAASCCRRLLLCCCCSSSSACCGCCSCPSAPPPVVDWRRVKGLVLSLACTIIAAPSTTSNTTSMPPRPKTPRAALSLVVIMAWACIKDAV